MSINKQAYEQISSDLKSRHVNLVAVSKTKSVEEIKALYDLGQREFGENYVQELTEKQSQLPGDIRWHFIGHLQSNKARQITSFIHFIQSVDSLKLLREINKEAKKNNRIVSCLLQVHIAREETKFGLDETELDEMFNGAISQLLNVRICGLMGMASFSDDLEIVRSEFKYLKTLFDKYAKVSLANCQFSTLSMGMSGDYVVALEEGSTMVRIGSLIFGARS